MLLLEVVGVEVEVEAEVVMVVEAMAGGRALLGGRVGTLVVFAPFRFISPA